jgi:hypothetical protein
MPFDLGSATTCFLRTGGTERAEAFKDVQEFSPNSPGVDDGLCKSSCVMGP